MIKVFELGIVIALGSALLIATMYLTRFETPTIVPVSREASMYVNQILSELVLSRGFNDALYAYICKGDDHALRAMLRALAPPGHELVLTIEIVPGHEPRCLACRNATLAPISEPFNATGRHLVASAETTVTLVEKVERSSPIGSVELPSASIVRVRLGLFRPSP